MPVTPSLRAFVLMRRRRLDDKQFSFFWPHGEIGVWQGISRFETGQRIEEFQDRRSNPRLILESQRASDRLLLIGAPEGLIRSSS